MADHALRALKIARRYVADFLEGKVPDINNDREERSTVFDLAVIDAAIAKEISHD